MAVDTISLENRVLDEGQSVELQACFQIIQETTVDDVDKYPDKVCRELARAIVCRTYASAIHELCHLVVAAGALAPTTRRYEGLFWDSGPARARNFLAYFDMASMPPAHLEIGDNQVALEYADKPFAISYGRMPFLSALMEFLMTALGYTELDNALAPLMAEFPTADTVSDAANALSRKLYGYLGDHLPTVQEQRRHRSFLTFVAEKAAGESADKAIDDASVFDYWLEQSAGAGEDTGTDSRTYRSVFRTAVRLLGILRLAADKRGIAVALPIGTDREAGEVDPSELEAAVAEIEEVASPVAALEATTADGVKIFNKRELETLRLALHGEDTARMLTRSILRNAVFGDAQARLTQALRQGLDTNEISTKIADEPETGYAARMDTFTALAKHTERMMLISFHVLYRAGHRDAINAALALRPNMDLSGLGEGMNEPDGNVVSFQAVSAAKRFFEADGEGPLGELVAEAAKAAKGIARQGFSEGSWVDADVMEIFADGVAKLALVRCELNTFIEQHALGIDWDALEESDTPLFREQFTRLYGDEND